jgi:hypothetical protein
MLVTGIHRTFIAKWNEALPSNITTYPFGKARIPTLNSLRVKCRALRPWVSVEK